MPLIDEMVEALQSALSGRVYGPEDWVFINPLTGGHYTHRAVGNIFARAKKATGYKVTLNEFGRHSRATQRLDAGWTYEEVSRFLLNTAAQVEKAYANTTKATRTAIIHLRKSPTKKEVQK